MSSAQILPTTTGGGYRQVRMQMLGDAKELSSGAGLVSGGLGTETQVCWLHSLRPPPQRLSHTASRALKSPKEPIKIDSRADPGHRSPQVKGSPGYLHFSKSSVTSNFSVAAHIKNHIFITAQYTMKYAHICIYNY